MTLTKAQIVEALFAEDIFTNTQSAQIIETLFELIKQSLENGEDVLISERLPKEINGRYQRLK
jgi:integration host factor subunit alpha